MGTAVVLGHRPGSFKAVAVATDLDDYCSPCGMCRQFLREFLDLKTPIFMFSKHGKYIVRTMEELLPLSFGPDKLPPREELKEQKEKERKMQAPKRGSSPYMFFANDQRDIIRAENPGMNFGDLGRLLGEMWKALSEEERAPYEAKAAEYEKRHQEEKTRNEQQEGS